MWTTQSYPYFAHPFYPVFRHLLPLINFTNLMELERLWKNTQEELKIVLAPSVYQTFVVKTQLIAFQNDTATISCPNGYLADMNQKRYYAFFKSALDNH
jgi:hypothetical protein